MTSRLLAAIASRPLLLDGGMGTRLIARGLDLATDDPALWNLSHPGIVHAIHSLDVAAGSDVLLTNTFGANPACLARHGREADAAAINQRAVALARDAAGPDRFLLGSIGPTAAGSDGADRAQAEALAEGGVDGLLLETHTSGQALAGLGALRRSFDLPIFVGLCSFDEPVGDAARRLMDGGADVLGINCMSPDVALSRIGDLFQANPKPPLLCKPAASHPDAPPVTPPEFAEHLIDWLRWDVRLMGGCCGATEAHVSALRSALDRAMSDRV